MYGSRCCFSGKTLFVSDARLLRLLVCFLNVKWFLRWRRFEPCRKNLSVSCRLGGKKEQILSEILKNIEFTVLMDTCLWFCACVQCSQKEKKKWLCYWNVTFLLLNRKTLIYIPLMRCTIEWRPWHFAVNSRSDRWNDFMCLRVQSLFVACYLANNMYLFELKWLKLSRFDKNFKKIVSTSKKSANGITFFSDIQVKWTLKIWFERYFKMYFLVLSAKYFYWQTILFHKTGLNILNSSHLKEKHCSVMSVWTM